ncbi:hypothetical protein E2320_016613 [Naja naja]|nr:hypothetical protein E2320_016613 [Naja naja]
MRACWCAWRRSESWLCEEGALRDPTYSLFPLDGRAAPDPAARLSHLSTTTSSSVTTAIKTLIKAHALILEATPNELLVLLISFQSRNRWSRRRQRRRQLWRAEHKGMIVRRCFGGKVLIREEIIDFHGTYRDGEEILGNRQNPIYIHVHMYFSPRG